MKYRTLLTLLLAMAGLADMAFYSWCDTSCSYLKGDILGIDLKYVGIAFMVIIIIFTTLRQMDMVRLLLSGAIGGEVVLVHFQFREDVFCPFCLAFGTIVLILYFLHYGQSQKDIPGSRKLLFIAGDAKIPGLGYRIPLILIMLLGYLFMNVAFTGTATPSYGAGQPSVQASAGGPQGSSLRQRPGLSIM